MKSTHQAFLAAFNDPRKPLIEVLLSAINDAYPGFTETIKWNAPSFSQDGKDRLTFMLHKPDRVVLVLHTGAKAKEDKKAPRLYQDDTGLLEWQSNIRALITFRDVADFAAKEEQFKQAVKRWLEETAAL